MHSNAHVNLNLHEEKSSHLELMITDCFLGKSVTVIVSRKAGSICCVSFSYIIHHTFVILTPHIFVDLGKSHFTYVLCSCYGLFQICEYNYAYSVSVSLSSPSYNTFHLVYSRLSLVAPKLSPISYSDSLEAVIKNAD